MKVDTKKKKTQAIGFDFHHLIYQGPARLGDIKLEMDYFQALIYR